jgi:hypothetical protein
VSLREHVLVGKSLAALVFVPDDEAMENGKMKHTGDVAQ